MTKPSLPGPGRGGQFCKTKLCRFELMGICAKGPECPFAHGSTELKPLPDLRCTRLCKELLSNGQCTDQNCTYAHSREQLRRAFSAKADGARPVGKQSRDTRQRTKLQRGTEQNKESPQPLDLPLLTALKGALDIQADAERKELELYTKALAAVLGAGPYNVSSPPGLGVVPDLLGHSTVGTVADGLITGGQKPFEPMEVNAPAYVPLPGLDDGMKNPFELAGTGFAEFETADHARNVAEEVAAIALDDS